MYIRIKSVVELSIEELEEMKKKEHIDGITVEIRRESSNYSVEEYKQIYEKLLELTKGIDEEWSQTKKFVLIYNRVSSNIQYDHIAGYPEKGNKKQEEYSRKESSNCRNLKNGLLLGKCVCAGYAEILRNACLLKGVPAIEIDGPTNFDTCHAWNQVEVDNGEWIEVDPTWDHNHGTEFIGINKEEFWETHRRETTIYSIISLDEHMVSNFDLDAFINKEFGLDMQYSTQERNSFLQLLDKRDSYGLDISGELDNLIKGVKFRQQFEQEFEQECGYTIEELKELGFTVQEIEQMQMRFDGITGARIDRKGIVEKRVNFRQEFEQEFEQECGYTIEELKELGFTVQEIEQMQMRFDGITGAKIDRQEIVKKRITEKNAQPTKLPKTVLSKEESENLKLKCQGLHPDILITMIREIEEGYISLEDAYAIINYKKGNGDIKYIDAILQKRKTIENREYIQEFESECGYTIEKLKELGFTDQEIEQMQARFDGITGEKIDRKKVVEKEISRRNIGKITLQEIGKGTIKSFSNDPVNANKAFKTLEQGVRRQNRTNDGFTQGE